MDSGSTLSEYFKKIILEFISSLKETVFLEDERKGELFMVSFFFERMDPFSLATYGIDYILPRQKEILARDDSFFINNPSIFRGIPSDRIEYYSQYWSENKICEENKTIIWEYMDTILEILKQFKLLSCDK